MTFWEFCGMVMQTRLAWTGVLLVLAVVGWLWARHGR
jgi:hypothetical protein